MASCKKRRFFDKFFHRQVYAISRKCCENRVKNQYLKVVHFLHFPIGVLPVPFFFCVILRIPIFLRHLEK